MDGLFHGKSRSKMDDWWGIPISGNLQMTRLWQGDVRSVALANICHNKPPSQAQAELHPNCGWQRQKNSYALEKTKKTSFFIQHSIALLGAV